MDNVPTSAMSGLRERLSPTAIANYFSRNRSQSLDENDYIPPSQIPSQTSQSSESSKGKGKSNRSSRTYDCPECDTRVKKLIECEFCNKWMCLTCADLSTEAYKVADEWKHALHFYCKHCFPNLNNLIINHQSAPDLNKSLTELKNKIDDLSQQLTELPVPPLASMERSTTTSLQPEPTINQQMDAVSIVDEFADRERRKNKIVLSSVPEPTGSNQEARRQSDLDTVRNIMNEYRLQGIQISNAYRLGKFDPSNPRSRLLLAELNDSTQRGKILSAASKKRPDNPRWSNVYISPDLTPQQRLEGKRLRDELKRRRTLGETNLIIRHGKIIKDPRATTSQQKTNQQTSSQQTAKKAPAHGQAAITDEGTTSQVPGHQEPQTTHHPEELQPVITQTTKLAPLTNAPLDNAVPSTSGYVTPPPPTSDNAIPSTPADTLTSGTVTN